MAIQLPPSRGTAPSSFLHMTDRRCNWQVSVLGFVSVLSVAVLQTPAFTHETHQRSSHAERNGVVHGVVFHDQDGDHVRSGSEPGIAGVKVSNGLDIVHTNAAGEYSLPIGDDDIIFVVKPRNWKTPTNKLKLPQFYYIHKPNGSPADFRFPGVKPTGPLPESVDFPLTPQAEPDKFRALLFGDTQPRDIKEVEYIAHDVIEQVVAEDAHGASFGVTLGDIVFDDLSLMGPLNQAIALIDIPWYNVIGNHDLNLDAKNDAHSDETFESIYGPSYYSFDYGPTHFLVLDDVLWEVPENETQGGYRGGFGKEQLEFVRADLASIPEDQLVVLLMHIPLTDVGDRQDLYRLIEQRPAMVSVSAHTHYMEHRFIGQEDGWMGPEKHHHVVNVTVCGSWWRGQPDERGIPHATMSDGGPNGYSIMEFDGANYSLELRPASRPPEYQMNIYAPETVSTSALASTVIQANVFAASEKWVCEMRIGEGPWIPMQRITIVDPGFQMEKTREEELADRSWTELPGPHPTPHFYRAMLPADVAMGTQMIQVKATEPNGKAYVDHRIMRVE